VLAVGPGKWIEGAWWKRFEPLTLYMEDADTGKPFSVPVPGSEWEWVPGYRETPEVSPGQIVLFSSKWNDLASTHYDDDKSALFDPLLHLIQEADILGITS
jgi:hypothetical protein